jgi:ribonuclease J
MVLGAIMSSLTFYGGIGEVGGNKILLEDGGKRLWLDFGMSFTQASKYFAEFLQPKKYNGVLDFLEMDLLPRLSDMGGFYRQDYLAHSGIETWDQAAYDAVFLSHAHADHSFYIHFLRKEIPIFASEVTRQILTAVENTSTSGLTDFLTYKETFKLRPKKTGGQMRVKGEEAKTARDFRVIEERAVIGEVAIEALPVNHSIPGALGFIIHTSAGAVVYTGDLRFHGYGGELSTRFVERAAEIKPIALICEGTRIEETESRTEQEVQDVASKLVRDTRNLVIVNYPWRDIERMRSFYEVAKSSGRRLAVSLK